MNRTAILGTLVLAAAATSAFAGTGLAGDITIETQPFASTRTQAAVQADLAQYRQAGVNPWSTSYNPLKSFRSAKTRAEVAQEYIASRDEVRGMTAEDSGSAYLAQHRVSGAPSQLAGDPTRQQ